MLGKIHIIGEKHEVCDLCGRSTTVKMIMPQTIIHENTFQICENCLSGKTGHVHISHLVKT